MSNNDSHRMDKLWNSWLKDKNELAANELIKNHMHLVDFHVERIASHIPANFDKEELRSFALIGLFDAINRFDPSRELKFDTYATFRIRGSIMDGLRKEDWLPRRLRDLSKKIDETSQQLEQKLQRKPTSAEIGAQLDLSEEEVESIISNAIFANVISIDAQQRRSRNDDDHFVATIVDEDAVLPEDHILHNEIRHRLIKQIKNLNENEQLVISLFYNEELTLTEIGEVLNLTTSRISQIHKRAIYKLKETLGSF